MAPSEPKPFGVGALIRRNVAHYWRTNLAVALGCAVAVAALAGSLLVGDSVRGSLRDIALERLGPVEYAVQSPGNFFREQLAADLLAQPQANADDDANGSRKEAQEAQGEGNARLHQPLLTLAPLRGKGSFADFAVPAILMEGAAKPADGGAVVNRVSVIGVPPQFFTAFSDKPVAPVPQDRQIIVNSTLAADLGVSEGDAILLTLGRKSDAPEDSIFAYRSRARTTCVLRLIVGRIIPARGLGAFSLRQEPSSPRNVYVALDWLQTQSGQPGLANTILIGRRAATGAQDESDALPQALSASAQLADYGLRLRLNPEFGYFALQSRQILLPPAAVFRAESAAKELGMNCIPSSVYLAVSMSHGRNPATVPYSVIAGLDPTSAPASPLPMVGGGAPPVLGPHDILLNSWAADQLGASVGDRIDVVYPGLEGIPPLSPQIRGIVAMEGPALDRGLVPEFEGVTDATTLADWHPPFPMNLRRIRPADEAYWKKHGPAPKAFMVLDQVRTLWVPGGVPIGAGFTSVALVPPKGMTLEAAAERFEKAFLRAAAPGDFGLAVQPVREQALEAARGTTDFGVIFLSMSLFIVAAAALMVGLLLRLAVERRAGEFGILTATGFPPRTAARVLAGEGLLLGAAGVVLGAPGGVGYAWLILHALRTQWSGAVGDVDLHLHVSAAGLLLGSAAGFLVSAAAVLWATRLLRRTPTLTLLAGWRAMAAQSRGHSRVEALGIGFTALGMAVLCVLIGLKGGRLAEGAFMAGGALTLVGLLALVCARFQRVEEPCEGSHKPSQGLSLRRLAWRGAARNWLRSLLTVGLLACASFVLVVVAASRKDVSGVKTSGRDSGAGGFSLVARSDIPLMADLNTNEGREALGFSPEAARAPELAGSRIFAFHMTSGDDASCLNIQRPIHPRVLGVPDVLIRRGGFTFAALAGKTDDPWRFLGDTREVNDDLVPAFADATSAEWVLHAGLGGKVQVLDSSGKPFRLKIVGLLADSVFAGELLISEAQFRRHFGANEGYRFFLVATPPGAEDAVARTLRENLGGMGFDVRRTSEVLAGYARVQNTYLATFQTLGGLGLFLGTFGIVTVLLRSIVERRSELAMLLALGLRRRQLVAMIVIEHGMLLLLGLAVGSAAALVAVVPHMLSTNQAGLSDVNWLSLGGMLFACVFVGLLTCAIFASRLGGISREELLPALRSE